MNSDELRRIREDVDKAVERAIERANAPTLSEQVFGQIIERDDARRAAEYEAGRQEALDRMWPIWEANAAKTAANEVVEDEAAHEARLAADPSSWTALLNRNKERK